MSRPLPLYVPDLEPGAGARIDRDGRVHCVACGRAIALRDADIVGLGYRCAPCGLRGDDGAHLRPSELVEAERRRPPIRASHALVAAIVLFAVLGAMWHFHVDPGGRVFVRLFALACGCAYIAIVYRKQPMI